MQLHLCALALCTLCSSLTACARGAESSTPPPLPEAPALAEPAPEPEPEQRTARAEPAPRKAVEAREPARRKREKPSREDTPARRETAAPRSAEPQVASPPPLAPPRASVADEAPRSAALKKRVTVPRTEHVRVEIPTGLQADLDADPRMQPWLDRVIAVADACHAKQRDTQGTVAATITMHENERPSVDLRSVPGTLGGIVACAGSSLMRVKMPLFTGKEGTRYDVRVVFE